MSSAGLALLLHGYFRLRSDHEMEVRRIEAEHVRTLAQQVEKAERGLRAVEKNEEIQVCANGLTSIRPVGECGQRTLGANRGEGWRVDE